MNSPLCGNMTFTCKTLEFVIEKTQAEDVIMVENEGTNSIIYQLCSAKPLDKKLYFKGTESFSQPKIGCSRIIQQNHRANNSSERVKEFFVDIISILEITNGAVFENITFEHGSIIIYNANVIFTNCTVNDVTIYVMGRDVLSYYTWKYHQVDDIWFTIGKMQRNNESLDCQNAEVTFDNTTWKYVDNSSGGNNGTIVFLDGLISDGIQVVCEAITLNILNSFMADKFILLNTILLSHITISNSHFKGEGKGNITRAGINMFSYQAPQMTIDKCSFENLKFSDPFVPILYKHSKLCKYKAGAITIQTVSTDNSDTVVGSLRIKQSKFVQNTGALTVSVVGDGMFYSKLNITITDSTFTENSNIGHGGALSLVKGIGSVYLERSTFHYNSVGTLKATFVYNGTEYYCSSFKYMSNTLVLTRGGMGAKMNVHVSKCTKDLSVCDPGEMRHIILSFNGQGGAIGMQEGSISVNYCQFKFNRATELGDAIHLGENTAYFLDHCKITTRTMRYSRGFTLSASSTKGSKITNTVFTVTSGTLGVLYHNTVSLMVDNIFVRNITIKCAPSSRMTFVNSTATDPFGDQGHKKRLAQLALLGFIDLMYWCGACPKGTYSLQGDTFNVDVKNGSEVTKSRHVKCTPCPYGATCSERVRPKANMWGQVENNAIVMYSCPGGYCCPGQECPRYNSCAKNRGSVLCGKCVTGYSEALFSPNCISNEECTMVQFLLMLFGFGITYVVVFIFQKDLKDFLFAPMDQKKKPMQTNGIKRVRKLARRVSSVDSARPCTEQVNSNGDYVLRNISVIEVESETTAKNETQKEENGVSESNNKGDDKSNSNEQETVVLNHTTEQSNETRSEGGIFLVLLFYYFQDAALVHIDTVYLNRDSSTKGTVKEIMGGLFQFRLDLFSLLDDMCAMPDFTPIDKIVFRMSFAVIVFCLYFVIYIFMKLCETACKANISKIQNRLTIATMFAVLFSFQSIVSTLLNLIHCITLGGRTVLLIEANCHCFTSWQIGVFIYVATCVIPFTLYITLFPTLMRSNNISPSMFFAGCLVPLPVASYSFIKRKTLVKSASTNSSKALYNLLQGPYRDLIYSIPFSTKKIYICWGGLYLVRRLILVLLKIFIQNVLVRLSIMTLFSMLSLFHHMIIWPCKERKANISSFVSALALVLICMANNIKAAFEAAEYIPIGVNKYAILAVQMAEDLLVLWIPISGVILIFLVLLHRIVIRTYNKIKS